MAVFDTVIVGAGPAGSAAAYDLVRAGVKVLIVDKEDFPRDKPCGGGLTVKTIKALRFDVGSVVSQKCDRVSLTNNLKRPVKALAPGTILHMTVRKYFDKLCLERAIAAGAAFSKAQIVDARERGETIELYTADEEIIAARFIVAADGAKSTMRRIVLPEDKTPRAFALEGQCRVPEHYDQRQANFDFFYLPGGYGWIFPKGDHLNIGIGSFKKGKHGRVLSKAALGEYCKSKLGHGDLRHVKGYPLCGGGDIVRISSGRVLFAGDAAGTVESLLGEGIYNAVISGQAAAGAITKAMKQGHDPRMCAAFYEQDFAKIRKELSFSRRAGVGFYRFPALSYLFLRLLPVQRKVLAGIAEGKTVRDIAL